MAETTPDKPDRRVPAARWVAVMLLGVIAACLLFQAGMTTSQVRAQVSTGGQGGKIFAMAGQVTSNSYGLYLVDLENGTIAMYQWLPSIRKLRFMAARNYTFDLKLEDWNTTISPREVRDLVAEQQRLKNTTTQP